MNYTKVTVHTELSPDHLPIVFTLNSTVTEIKIIPNLTNKTTQWEHYTTYKY